MSYQELWEKILPDDQESAKTLKEWNPELFLGLKGDELEEAMKPLKSCLKSLLTKQFLRYESQKRRDEEQKNRIAQDEKELDLKRKLQDERPQPSPKKPKDISKYPEPQFTPYGAQKYLSLPKEYLEESGLNVDVFVYCRDAFEKQWKFLENVVKNHSYGWILGPPGTGKSTCSFGFMLKLKPEEWNRTWFHFSAKDPTKCIQMKNTSRTCTRVEIDDIKEIFSNQSDKNHIVFVDGYKNETEYIDFLKQCRLYGNETTYYVVICSLSTRGKSNDDDDKISKVEECFVDSWKRDEYHLAVANPQFFKRVESMLDAQNEITEEMRKKEYTPEELIDLKHYYAGGSSRYMFGYNTKDVIGKLNVAINSIENFDDFIKSSVGSHSSKSTNRLFNVFEDRDKIQTSELLCEFVLSALSTRVGPTAILNLYTILGNMTSPALEGWIFECYFFATLQLQDIVLHDVNDVKREKLSKSPFTSFNPADPPQIPTSSTWLRPIKWNQGGYDAVYVDRERSLVRFYQITRADSHSLKLSYFAQLMWEFAKQFVTNTVEIYFVVPFDKVAKFRINPNQVESSGVLSEFNFGTIPKEDKERIEKISLVKKKLAAQNEFRWKKNGEHEQIKVCWIEKFKL